MSSCPHLVWALRQRGLTSAERVVLIYLADRANGSLFCWPSMPTIATDCELSVRTARSAVGRLQTLGMIRIERRDQQANTYHILRKPTPAKSAPPTTPAKPAAKPRQKTTSPPAKAAKPPRQNLPPNPLSKNPLKESLKGESARARAQPPRLAGPIPLDWQPDVKGVAFAQERSIDLRREIPKFVDYHIAHGRKGITDWPAAWRTWCRNEVEFRDRRSQPDPMQRDPSKLSGAALARYRFDQLGREMEEQQQAARRLT